MKINNVILLLRTEVFLLYYHLVMGTYTPIVTNEEFLHKHLSMSCTVSVIFCVVLSCTIVYIGNYGLELLIHLVSFCCI